VLREGVAHISHRAIAIVCEGIHHNRYPSLRMVIDKALAANMKRDTIESAVKRGSGDLDGDNYEEVRYEGYGLAGTAIMVDTLTDNRNRTVADVRHAFSKHGGNLGTDGSGAYLFNKQGFISFASGGNHIN
jgi:transcriptional/translational regulatory protein YebC/TACO1